MTFEVGMGGKPLLHIAVLTFTIFHSLFMSQLGSPDHVFRQFNIGYLQIPCPIRY